MEEQRRSYFKDLDKEHAKRYLEKISVIESTDPYCLKRVDMSKDVLLFPLVTYPDIVNYMLFAPSPLTRDKLKCYKSLDTYCHFVSGWVKEISVKVYSNGKILITGRVCWILSSPRFSYPFQPLSQSLSIYVHNLRINCKIFFLLRC